MPEGWVLLGGAAVVVLVLVWLVVLTVLVARRRPDPGEPVYRTLPDGRTRFTWHVAQGLARAQRQAAADLDLRSRY